jgi:hypothetical protein
MRTGIGRRLRHVNVKAPARWASPTTFLTGVIEGLGPLARIYRRAVTRITDPSS